MKSAFLLATVGVVGCPDQGYTQLLDVSGTLDFGGTMGEVPVTFPADSSQPDGTCWADIRERDDFMRRGVSVSCQLIVGGTFEVILLLDPGRAADADYSRYGGAARVCDSVGHEVETSETERGVVATYRFECPKGEITVEVAE